MLQVFMILMILKCLHQYHEDISSRTAYNWKVNNLGISSRGISQIVGPMSGGKFNTESAFGYNRTFKISWSGTSSNASFKIKAVGQDSGNSGKTVSSGSCSGSSGSTTLTMPYEARGEVKLYVESYTSGAINIGTLHVDIIYSEMGRIFLSIF